ncbi:hypothetical protein BZA77DRAFT_361417 [Pyronema omphalodes]|nr:hypothetical protein BZA77DRAFT_361417 [Pyronema omphalodes]
MAYTTVRHGAYNQATQPEYSQTVNTSTQSDYRHQFYQSNLTHQEHRSDQSHQPAQHNPQYTWLQEHPQQSNQTSQLHPSHQFPHSPQQPHKSQITQPSNASQSHQAPQAPQGTQLNHRPMKQKKSVTYLNHRAPGLSDTSLHKIPMPDHLAHAWGVSPERMPPLPPALRAGVSSEGNALSGNRGYETKGYGQKSSHTTLKVTNPEPKKKDKGKGKEKDKSTAVNEQDSFDSNPWATVGASVPLGVAQVSSGPHGNTQALNLQNQQNQYYSLNQKQWPASIYQLQTGQASAAVSSNPLNMKQHPLPPFPASAGESGLHQLPAPIHQSSYLPMADSERKWKARMDANDYPFPPQLQSLGQKGTTQQVKQMDQTKEAETKKAFQSEINATQPTQDTQRYPQGLHIPAHLQAPTQPPHQAPIQPAHQTQQTNPQQAHQPYRYPPGLPIPRHLQQPSKPPPGLAYNGHEFETPTPGSLWGPSTSGDKGKTFNHGTSGNTGQRTGTEDQYQGIATHATQRQDAQGPGIHVHPFQGQGTYTSVQQPYNTNHQQSQHPNTQRPPNLAPVMNNFSQRDDWPLNPQTRYPPTVSRNPLHPTQQSAVPIDSQKPSAAGPSGLSNLTRPPIAAANLFPQSSAFATPETLTLPYNPYYPDSIPSHRTSGDQTAGRPAPTPNKIHCPRPMKIAKMPSDFTLKKQWKDAGWIEDDGVDEGPRKRKLQLWTQQDGWVEEAGDDDEDNERNSVAPQEPIVQPRGGRNEVHLTEDNEQFKRQQINHVNNGNQKTQKWMGQEDQQLKWNSYGEWVDKLQNRPEVEQRNTQQGEVQQQRGEKRVNYINQLTHQAQQRNRQKHQQPLDQAQNKPEAQNTQQPQPPPVEYINESPNGQDTLQIQKVHDLEQVVVLPLEQGQNAPVLQRNPLATYVHQVHPVYQPPPAKPSKSELQYQKYLPPKTAKAASLRKPVPVAPRPNPQVPPGSQATSQSGPRKKTPKLHRVQLYDNPVPPFFDLPKPPVMSSMLPWNFSCPPSGLYFDLPLYPASFLPNTPISSLKTGDKIVVENRLSYFSHYDHRRQRAVVIDFERMLIRSGRAKLHQKVHVADVEYVDCEVIAWQLHFNCLQLDTNLFAKPVYIARNKHILGSQLVETLQEVKDGKRMRIWLAVWMDYAFVLGWNVPGTCLLRHSIGSMGQKAEWYWHCCGDRDQKIIEESALRRIPKQDGDLRWCGWCAGAWKR